MGVSPDLDLCSVGQSPSQRKNISDINNNVKNISNGDEAGVSCCVLTPIDYDLNIFTNELVPLYGCKDTGEFSRFKSDGISAKSEIELNYSALEFPNEIWVIREPWEIGVKTAAVVPLVIIAILGNFLVMKIVIKSKALRQNPVNLFIFNMSIADLLCALIFPWVFLITDFYQQFVLGAFVCRTEGFFMVTLLLTSVFTLVVISFDRLVAIVFPFNIRISPRWAKCIIYAIWIIACIISTPLIIWREYKERQWKDFLEKYCTEDFEKLQYFWLTLVILLVWVPLAILILSYTAIVIKLDALERRQRDQPLSQVKHKSKVIRMLFIVVLVFSICWIPFTALIFIRNHTTTKSSTEITELYRAFFFVSRYLMFLNNALNPIIYGLLNDNLRRELRCHGLPTCLKKQNRIEVSTVLRNGKIGIVDQAKNAEKTKLQKAAAKYGIVLSTTSSSIPSLNSFERQNSAFLDVDLPFPPPDPSSSNSLEN